MLFFFSELQLQLNVMDKKLTQKNEEMNILLNYKVNQKGGNGFQVKRFELFLFTKYLNKIIYDF